MERENLLKVFGNLSLGVISKPPNLKKKKKKKEVNALILFSCQVCLCTEGERQLDRETDQLQRSSPACKQHHDTQHTHAHTLLHTKPAGKRFSSVSSESNTGTITEIRHSEPEPYQHRLLHSWPTIRCTAEHTELCRLAFKVNPD